MRRLELIALPGLPMVAAGDDLAALIEAGLTRAGLALAEGDVLVLAQKIVDWRAERGRFGSVDQLREVTGIGESKYADLVSEVAVP